MSQEDPPPRATSGSPLAWMLLGVLASLVLFLAWRVHQLTPAAVRDPGSQAHLVTPRGDLADDEKSTVELFRKASPAVVHVANLAREDDLFSGTSQEVLQGTGSGFLWEHGYVVTNNHVVRGGDSFVVMLSDHASFPATPVGRDPYHDLAVLRIDAGTHALPTLPLGTSSDLLVGQKVFAIGNPFGLDQTLTTGIISGTGREITAELDDGTIVPLQGTIQTDAAINPGNSGGPLLDSAGRLIGMNAAITSPSGASAGVGFAIPVDTINRIVPQIIRTGTYRRADLGIITWPDFNAKRVGVRGVLLRAFTRGSTAERAGLRLTRSARGRPPRVDGDAITAIDDQPVEGTADLYRALDAHEPGQTVAVTYLRDGKEFTVKVQLVGAQ